MRSTSRWDRWEGRLYSSTAPRTSGEILPAFSAKRFRRIQQSSSGLPISKRRFSTVFSVPCPICSAPPFLNGRLSPARNREPCMPSTRHVFTRHWQLSPQNFLKIHVGDAGSNKGLTGWSGSFRVTKTRQERNRSDNCSRYATSLTCLTNCQSQRRLKDWRYLLNAPAVIHIC